MCNYAIEIFVGFVVPRSARRLVKRAECFPYARLGTLFERIARLLIGTDKDSRKRKRDAGGTCRGCVRGATWISRIKSDRTAMIPVPATVTEVHFRFLHEQEYMPGIYVAPNLFLRVGEPKVCNSGNY